MQRLVNAAGQRGRDRTINRPLYGKAQQKRQEDHLQKDPEKVQRIGFLRVTIIKEGPERWVYAELQICSETVTVQLCFMQGRLAGLQESTHQVVPKVKIDCRRAAHNEERRHRKLEPESIDPAQVLANFLLLCHLLLVVLHGRANLEKSNTRLQSSTHSDHRGPGLLWCGAHRRSLSLY